MNGTYCITPFSSLPDFLIHKQFWSPSTVSMIPPLEWGVCFNNNTSCLEGHMLIAGPEGTGPDGSKAKPEVRPAYYMPF